MYKKETFALLWIRNIDIVTHFLQRNCFLYRLSDVLTNEGQKYNILYQKLLFHSGRIRVQRLWHTYFSMLFFPNDLIPQTSNNLLSSFLSKKFQFQLKPFRSSRLTQVPSVMSSQNTLYFLFFSISIILFHLTIYLCSIGLSTCP